jgi:cytochrome c oxidase subunit 3
MVDPSPWPIVGTIGALLTFGGAVMWFHGGAPWIMVVGMAVILYTMFMWWKDVVKEGTFEGHHTPVVQIGLRYGMALFIASEVMFFVAWFWAFFNASLYPTEAMGGIWPPEGIETFDPWHLPFINTVILLTSGTTVTWAHHALRNNDRTGLLAGLAVTVALGMAFTAVQAYEYVHAPFTFTGGIYGTTFFMATGFHGAHVIIGTIFLIVCLFRSYKGHFKPDHHFGLEAAAWYWHFVDVVWLFLFCGIYWWGGS